VGKVASVDGVQEVRLILCAIARLQELGARGRVRETCVVARRKEFSAEALRVLQAHPELDFPVTENVRIRRAAGTLLGEEIVEYALAIFGREAHSMQRDS